mmetsp:Transcript_12026/g.17893  ORF Transcript_12026/g.17893 Transcript_12026/m.17893 type:complete len:172 (-) Transcript_12026:112-627(-)
MSERKPLLGEESEEEEEEEEQEEEKMTKRKRRTTTTKKKRKKYNNSNSGGIVRITKMQHLASDEARQPNCCIKGCDHTVTNRLRFSLRCRTMEDFIPEYIERQWNKVCHYHYFSDLYKFKKKKQQAEKESLKKKKIQEEEVVMSSKGVAIKRKRESSSSLQQSQPIKKMKL